MGNNTINNAKKVEDFLTNPVKLNAFFSECVRIVFSEPIITFLPENFPEDQGITDLLLKKESKIRSYILGEDWTSIYPYQSLGESFSTESLNSIAKLSAAPGYRPKKELLIRLLNQEAIRHLLATIIENAIIEFNKKINPFFGAIQLTGIDKQIKNFILPFLPGLLDRIADFIDKSANASEGRDLIENSVTALFQTKMDELIPPTESEKKEITELADTASDTLKLDAQLRKSVIEIYTQCRLKISRDLGNITVADSLSLNDEEKSRAVKRIAEVLTENVISIRNKSGLIQTITIFLETIDE